MLPGCGDEDEPGGTAGSGGSSAGKGGKAGSSGSAGKSGKAGSSGSGNAGRAGSSSGASGSDAGGSSGSAGMEETGGAGSPSSGGDAGTSGASGDAGTPGAGGDAGSPGAGGDAGSGGSGGSSAGSGGSGGSDPQSTACSDFPAAVTLGESFVLDTYGAVVCTLEDEQTCRLTTNTYTDGTNPCATADTIVSFFTTEPGTANVEHYVNANSTWHIVSTTAGTINTSFDYVLEDVPSGQSVTIVIRSPGNDEYEVVFQFENDRSFTLTSITAD